MVFLRPSNNLVDFLNEHEHELYLSSNVFDKMLLNSRRADFSSKVFKGRDTSKLYYIVS